MKIAIVEHLLHVAEAELFTTAKELGFDGVELSIGPYDVAFRTILQPDGPQRLRATAAAAGVALPSLTAGYFNRYPLVDPQPRVREGNADLLFRLIDACAEAGIGWLHVPFYGGNEIRSPVDERRLLEVMPPLVDRAAARGVVLGFGTLLPAEEYRRFVDQFRSSAVQMDYDIGNARAAGRDVVAELKLLRDRIGQIHAKDRDRREPFASVPLGQGTVNLPTVLATLAELHFDRWLVLETPSGDDSVASARQNLDFLRRLLP